MWTKCPVKFFNRSKIRPVPCERGPLTKPLVQFISSHPAPVVQKVDNAIHRINLCPVDNPNDFFNTYPLDSDLSGV